MSYDPYDDALKRNIISPEHVVIIYQYDQRYEVKQPLKDLIIFQIRSTVQRNLCL
jgi:hypothetical protein